MADILKITDTPIIDESIDEYGYHEYEPITGTSLNNGGAIRSSGGAIRIAGCVHNS